MCGGMWRVCGACSVSVKGGHRSRHVPGYPEEVPGVRHGQDQRLGGGSCYCRCVVNGTKASLTIADVYAERGHQRPQTLRLPRLHTQHTHENKPVPSKTSMQMQERVSSANWTDGNFLVETMDTAEGERDRLRCQSRTAESPLTMTVSASPRPLATKDCSTACTLRKPRKYRGTSVPLYVV